MNTQLWLAEAKIEDANAEKLRSTEKTIADMEVGERGYTTSWAFNLHYPVWQGACKTMDTLIERTKDGWKVIETDPGPAAIQEYRRSLLRPRDLELDDGHTDTSLEKPRLRPCPFCGAEPRVMSEGILDTVYRYVQCRCGVRGPMFSEHRHLAAQGWNKMCGQNVTLVSITRTDKEEL